MRADFLHPFILTYPTQIIKLAWLVLLLLIFTPQSGFSDTIALENGDHVTGEARSLAAGSLVVSTSWAGSITMDWAQVAIFETTRTMVIEWSGREPFEGSLHIYGEKAEALAVSGEVVASTRGALLGFSLPLPLTEGLVVQKNWSGSVDFGGSVSRGNSDISAVFLGTLFNYINGKHELELKARGDYSESDGDSTAEKWMTGAKYKYGYAKRFYVFGLGDLEGDRRSDIAYRARAGGGLGWQAIETERLKWDLEGGITGIYEDQRDGQSEASINQLWATVVHYQLNDRVSFSQRIQFESAFDDPADFLLTADSALITQLWKQFSLKLNLLDIYDSDPVADKKKNDLLMRTLLSYSF